MIIHTDIYEKLIRSGKYDRALKGSVSDFVATMFYDILKRMWHSIPRSGLIPETNAERWYTDMLMYEISKKMVRQDLKSLTKMIYSKLAKKVFESAEGSRAPKRAEGKNVRPDRRPEGYEHDSDRSGERSEFR